MSRFFVTGPSGSGKSTVAFHLSNQLNIPLLKCDVHPDWKPAMIPAHLYVAHGRPLEQDALEKRVAEETLAQAPAACVVEGRQLLHVPERLRDGIVILVFPPRDVVIRQRTTRKVKKAIQRSESLDDEKVKIFERFAGVLYDEDVPRVETLKQYVDPIVVATSEEVNNLLRSIGCART